MKVSDFVTTSVHRREINAQLAHTEVTDAINSGLVGKADKSGSALKESLYSSSKKQTGNMLSEQTAGHRVSKRAVTYTLDDTELEGADSLCRNVKSSYQAGQAIKARLFDKKKLDVRQDILRGAKASAIGGVSQALQDTELDGLDDAYYASRSVLDGARAFNRRILGKDATESQKQLGKLSEKKYQKTRSSAAEMQRKMQTNQRMHKSVSKAARARAAETRKLAKAASATSSGGGFLAAVSASSPVLITFLGIVLTLIIIFCIIVGMGHQQHSTGALTGVPAEVAACLREYGYSDEAIAAVLGNMKQENSGFDAGFDGYDYLGNPSLGLFQYSGSKRIHYLNWCTDNGKVWSAVSSQVEYTFGSGSMGWFHAVSTNYYNNCAGYEARYSSDYYKSLDEFRTADDLDLATYSFMACYERCANGGNANLAGRIAYAHDFYTQLKTIVNFAGGEDYASAEQWQKDIVNACYATPSPGSGLCAMWVSQVYSRAGLGYPVGNGNSILSGYATSSDWSNIKVGQIVSAQYGANNAAGNAYGHVGIYIGNGMIMDNTGSIRTTTLSGWIADYGRGWVVYGWPW